MSNSKAVELIESRGLEFKGFECLLCFFAKKETIIFNYRRNHLIKVHDYTSKSLTNESNLEEKNPFEADRFLILLGGKQLVCPHCPVQMRKYTGHDNLDFVVFSCQNEDCPYKKKHNHHFYSERLMQGVEKKKHFCSKHRWNSDKHSCNSCAWAKDFNKNVAPKLNKVFSEILNQ